MSDQLHHDGARPHGAGAVVVTRQGCHLCQDMVATLRSVAPDVPLTLVDLDQARRAGDVDEETYQRWTVNVPVLLVDGVERASLMIDPGRAAEILAGRGGGS